MAVVLVGGYLFGGVAGALSALVGGFGLSEMMRSMLQADKIRTQGSKTGFTTLVPLKGK
jgi:phage-related holin